VRSSIVDIRGRLVALGLCLVAVGLGVLGVGSAERPVTIRGVTYDVATVLMSEKGGPVYACPLILQSLPPQCGGGIRVNGADIEHIPGITRYSNGTLMTPVMHLVGNWDGGALTLTEQPKRGAPATLVPDPCIQPPGASSASGMPPRQQQVLDDQAALKAQGITVTEIITCGDTLGIGVVVADPATIRYLANRYGKVSVTGVLHPVASGK
jgi:hypothetical protein